MSPWIAAARPKTLSAGIIPVVVASALAIREEKFVFFVFLAALVGSVAIQVGTNYINDASDFLRGADTQDRLGPPRMAQTGALSAKSLYIGAGICFGGSLLAGIYLISIAGTPILWIGIASILAAIAYTAGPVPLAYYGLGDIFVLIFFGFVAVCGTFYAHTAALNLAAYLCAMIVGLLGVSLIIVNNARDIPTDARAKKRTMAVRMGERATKVYYTIVLVISYVALMILYWVFHRSSLILIPLVSLPLALKNGYLMFQAQQPVQYNNLLSASAKLQALFGALLAVAIIFS